MLLQHSWQLDIANYTRKANPRFSIFLIRHLSINRILSQKLIIRSGWVYVLQLILGFKFVSQKLKKLQSREFEKVSKCLDFLEVSRFMREKYKQNYKNCIQECVEHKILKWITPKAPGPNLKPNRNSAANVDNVRALQQLRWHLTNLGQVWMCISLLVVVDLGPSDTLGIPKMAARAQN